MAYSKATWNPSTKQYDYSETSDPAYAPSPYQQDLINRGIMTEQYSYTPGNEWMAEAGGTGGSFSTADPGILEKYYGGPQPIFPLGNTTAANTTAANANRIDFSGAWWDEFQKTTLAKQQADYLGSIGMDYGGGSPSGDIPRYLGFTGYQEQVANPGIFTRSTPNDTQYYELDPDPAAWALGNVPGVKIAGLNSKGIIPISMDGKLVNNKPLFNVNDREALRSVYSGSYGPGDFIQIGDKDIGWKTISGKVDLISPETLYHAFDTRYGGQSLWEGLASGDAPGFGLIAGGILGGTAINNLVTTGSLGGLTNPFSGLDALGGAGTGVETGAAALTESEIADIIAAEGGYSTLPSTGMAGTAIIPGGGTPASGGGSILSKLLDPKYTMTTADWAQMAGSGITSIAQYLGAEDKAGNLTDILNQTRADRLPALNEFNRALKNPDTWYNSEAAMAAAEAQRRALSGTYGNVAMSPTALSKAAAYSLGGYNDYMRSLAGPAFGTAGIEASVGTKAADSSGGGYGALGFLAGSLTQPQNSLEELLKKYTRGGSGNFSFNPWLT